MAMSKVDTVQASACEYYFEPLQYAYLEAYQPSDFISYHMDRAQEESNSSDERRVIIIEL
jgi:hypothetical protein